MPRLPSANGHRFGARIGGVEIWTPVTLEARGGRGVPYRMRAYLEQPPTVEKSTDVLARQGMQTT
jgi:hypothetical protein